MSLVNLSHVCSHLQNASLARLGLTSIPYSRLHLSLALLLQKQGFLSQVKLAGPSPPASCFPPGEDGHRVTGHPRVDRGRRTPESALQWVLGQGSKATAEALKRKGFDEEAIEFAMTRRLKTKAQLERDGWQEVAAGFLVEHDGMSAEDLQEQGVDEEGISFIQKHKPMLEECKQKVWDQHGHHEAEAIKTGPQEVKVRLQAYLREGIVREGLDAEILRYVAGDERFITQRQLNLEGHDIDAMGLTISNQPFHHPVPAEFEDPWQLEEEGVVTQANRASRRLWLGMKYWDGSPVLRKARMLSKPTKRIKMDYHDLGKLTRGKHAGEVKPLTQVGEIIAVNTKLGVLEIREAVERKLNGMVLCRIW